MDLDPNIFEIAQLTENNVPFHCKKADFGVDRHPVDHHSRTDLLEVPNDLVKGKRNLLLGFEFNNVRNLVFGNRRKFHGSKKARLAGDGNTNHVPFDRISREKLF